MIVTLLVILSVVLTFPSSECRTIGNTTFSNVEDGNPFANVSQALETRVIGGRSAGGVAPYAVAMVQSLTLQGKPMALSGCTGSYLGDGWVVTAAHCIEDNVEGTISIYLGTYDLNTPPLFKAGMKGKFKVPKLPRNTAIGESDLGLIKLDKVPPPSIKGIGKICLAKPRNFKGVTLTAFGYGSDSCPTKDLHLRNRLLKKATGVGVQCPRRVIKPDRCVCTLFNKGDGQLYVGDSGGPLVTTGADGSPLLAGVLATYGRKQGDPNECPDPKEATIFTSTHHYLSFIKKKYPGVCIEGVRGKVEKPPSKPSGCWGFCKPKKDVVATGHVNKPVSPAKSKVESKGPSPQKGKGTK